MSLAQWTTLGKTWEEHFDMYCGANTADASGCWIWGGAVRKKDGYGQILVKLPDGTQAIRSAHQAGWLKKYGSIPEKGLVLRHNCDNPRCCNPDHLQTGTQRDNVHDMIARGRNVRGEASKNSKLTTAKVIEARTAYKAGKKVRELAVENGVSLTLMSKVLSGERWKHVTFTA